MGQRYTSLDRRYGSFEGEPETETVDEDARLLYSENGDEENGDTRYSQRCPSTSSSESGLQDGVRKMEAISRTWTQRSLVVAYLGIFLMAFTTSLESQTIASLAAYATSSFSKHSLISTVMVVQNVVNAVVKPPMAKVADVFGRFEAFCICVLIYILGYAQMAASHNVETYASAQIFYSAGSTGLQILQQIFIADSSDLLNRALLASLPDLPFLATVWFGPMVASAVLKVSTWRWGYAIWIIILPAAFCPLAFSLFLNQRKARELHLLKERPWKGKGTWSLLRSAWYELDIMGLVLLSAGVILILIPLTLAARAEGSWGGAGIVAPIVVGGLCLFAFPMWESSKSLAPRPLLSLHLLKDRTALAGCALAFFYFMAFYSSVQPYFYSYLQVVHGHSVVTAGRVTQTFAFTSTISAVAVSFLIKFTRRYRPFVTGGCVIYIGGLLLMLWGHKSQSSVIANLAIQTIVGGGAGLLNVPVQLGVQASATHQGVAAATAMFLTSLEMGGAVGSAVSGAVWTSSVQKKLQLYLPPESKKDAAEIFGKLTKALSYPMGSPTRDAINRSYEETMARLLMNAVLVSIPLIPLSLLMKNYQLDKVNQKLKGTVVGNCDADDTLTHPVRGPRARRRSRASS